MTKPIKPCPPDHYMALVKRGGKFGKSVEQAHYTVEQRNHGHPIYLGCDERWWVFACPNMHEK